VTEAAAEGEAAATPSGAEEETDFDGTLTDADRVRMRQLEYMCIHLAMKPWVEVESAVRRQTEDHTAEVRVPAAALQCGQPATRLRPTPRAQFR